MTTAALAPDPPVTLRNRSGSLFAVLASVPIGSSAAGAEALASYPTAGGQTLRYCGAAVLLHRVHGQ
jgi:hypothetical protein